MTQQTTTTTNERKNTKIEIYPPSICQAVRDLLIKEDKYEINE